jgi:hypothetical protein
MQHSCVFEKKTFVINVKKFVHNDCWKLRKGINVLWHFAL